MPVKQKSGFEHALLRFTNWVQCTKKCDIVYAALCTTRSNTPPRPLIGIAYMAIGEYETFHKGGQHIPLPNGYVRISSAYKGAITNEPHTPVGMWSVALDVGGHDEFKDRYWQSLLEQTRVNNPTMLTQAYQQLAHVFLKRSPVSSPYFLKSALLNLCAVLLDDIALKANPDSLDSFELARNFIIEHYADAQLTQSHIAKAAFVSGRHLTRLFQQLASCTPMQYLRDIRLQQAKNLLETTLMTMSEITESIGLKDSLHFSRLFRQNYGMAPSVYRQQFL